MFVSSTYRDLKVERLRVTKIILELGCFPSGMETFPASHVDQWTVIKSMIDACDYVIVIVAGLYGSEHPETKKSYTRMEFEYAIETGKPVLAFLHGEPQNLPPGHTETSQDAKEKLEEFRGVLAKDRIVRPWTDPGELAAMVSISLINVMKDAPAEGWVRPSELPARTASPADAHESEVTPESLVREIGSVLKGSRFSRRLQIANHAKSAMARYVTEHGLWRSDDTVLMDTGTLPVYMVSRLVLDRRLNELRPRKILTNNILLALIEMKMGGDDIDMTQVPRLPDKPLHLVMAPGVVMENYGATMPGDLVRSKSGKTVSRPLLNYWRRQGVSHLIMMTTRITADDGPCVVAPSIRNYKRTMMKYALEDSEVRLTIMAHAEKIVGKREDYVGKKYWRKLIDRGNVSFICALSPGLGEADLDPIRREIERMRKMGLEVVLLDSEGGLVPAPASRPERE